MSDFSQFSNISKTALPDLFIATLLVGVIVSATLLSVAGAADAAPISSSNTDTITITINDSSNGQDTATTSVAISSDTDSAVSTIPGVGGNAPVDNDGDGLYEDVNGDGTTNFTDAVDLAFANFGSLTPAQQSALDFDGDNDVDFDDAVELAFNV